MQHHHHNNQKGFTLVEVLTSITILAIVLAVVLITYVDVIQMDDLDAQSESISNMLETAREQSLINLNKTNWGLHFTSSSYTLFQGTTYSSSSSSNVVYKLPADVSISSISLGASNSIVFNLINGSVSSYVNNSSITLKTIILGYTRIISINAQGTISIQ